MNGPIVTEEHNNILTHFQTKVTIWGWETSVITGKERALSGSNPGRAITRLLRCSKVKQKVVTMNWAVSCPHSWRLTMGHSVPGPFMGGWRMVGLAPRVLGTGRLDETGVRELRLD